ncbi:hypothetical protein F9856_03555 [Streptococcus suis]|uniref:hypothetical protein n=1 Tax=Streptococcus suis TaxID=1307 RepID=UPI001924BE99|nr:hypothetical protein [Streptococcus suis]MBL1125234.1 hypothetical protein [Streptococcus suis]
MKKKIFRTVLTSYLSQLVGIVFGLIAPGLIISHFGSDLRGLGATLSAYLGYFAAFDSSVPTIVQAQLYKPLADKDYKKVNTILNSAEQFFRRQGLMFALYALLIGIGLPVIIQMPFDRWTMLVLTLISAFGTFVEYMFRRKHRMLLRADGKSYVSMSIGIGMQVVTQLSVIVAVTAGISYLGYKSLMAGLGLLTPILIWLYVKRHYPFLKNESTEAEVIPLKNNPLAVIDHILYTTRNSSAIFIISYFNGLALVSVFTFYTRFVSMFSSLAITAFNNLDFVLGHQLATKSIEETRKSYQHQVYLWHNWFVYIYTVAACLFMAFLSHYARKFSGADYVQPVFAYVYLVSDFLDNTRIMSSYAFKAAGHWERNRKSFIFESIVLIVLSLVLFLSIGLVGLAVAAVVANLYRLFYNNRYLSREILYIDGKKSSLMSVGGALFIVVVGLSFQFLYPFQVSSYVDFILPGLAALVYVAVLLFVCNWVLSQEFRQLTKKLVARVFG